MYFNSSYIKNRKNRLRKREVTEATSKNLLYKDRFDYQSNSNYEDNYTRIRKIKQGKKEEAVTGVFVATSISLGLNK